MNENSALRVFSRDTSSRLAVGLAVGLVGGALGGIGAGLVSRLSMRGVAMLAGMGVSFSIGGTLFILVLGAFIGAIAGLPYGLVQSFLPGSIRVKALFYGLLLALLVVLAAFFGPREGELTLISRQELAFLFVPVPLIYVLILGWIQVRMEGGLSM